MHSAFFDAGHAIRHAEHDLWPPKAHPSADLAEEVAQHCLGDFVIGDHAITQRALADSLSASRRSRLHRKAAQANGACFYPVNPAQEEASWERFYKEAYDRFLAGARDACRFERASTASLHPGQSARVIRGDQDIGVIGALVLAASQGSLNWSTFSESLMGATRTSAMIALILAGAALSATPRTLRAANAKFTRRFEAIEAALAADGRRPEDSTLEEMDALWDAAKAREKRATNS